MRNNASFILKARIVTCASIAVLLTACGGSGSDNSAQSGQGVQTSAAAENTVTSSTTDASKLLADTTSSVTYLAENGTRTGNVMLSTASSSMIGKGFATYWRAAGDSQAFTVNAATAGDFNIAARYQNGGTDQTMSLYVNGVKIRQIKFPKLADWATWSNATEKVTLKAGSNVIKYQRDSADTAAIALNSIAVSAVPVVTAPAPAPTPAPAPAPAPTTPTTATYTPATPNNYYVATNGSDSNPGTQAAPFKTILKASTVAVPNSTVHVAPGTYTGGFTTSKSGTASGRIYYVSDVKWGAKIIAPNTSGSSIWANHGSYVTISGFDIDGSTTTSGTFRIGIYSDGSEITYQHNNVHNVGNKNVCSSNGGAGMNTDASKGGVNTQIYNNVVHHIGPAGCGTWYHGIYLSTSGKIKNNVVYANVGGGIHMWHDATHVDIINNTSFNNGYGIIVGSNGFFNKPADPGDYFNVMNNIFVNNSIQGVSEQGTTGTHNVYKNNLVWNNKTNWKHQNGTVDTGTVNADPQFVNYVAAGGGDYRLKSTSPAINKGYTTDMAPVTDYDGVARHGVVDIGAYEY